MAAFYRNFTAGNGRFVVVVVAFGQTSCLMKEKKMSRVNDVVLRRLLNIFKGCFFFLNKKGEMVPALVSLLKMSYVFVAF